MPNPEPSEGAPPTLHRVINTLQLWAIAVGMVISGIYFGWNYGWAVAGTLGFLVATLIVTVLYIAMAFAFRAIFAGVHHLVFANRG